MYDVLISGAGPAGSLAAIVLARAGVRVLMVDRAHFPRAKLCGDTVNPGALAVLRHRGLDAAERGLPIGGMIVTGPRGVRIETTYPAHVTGRALNRHALDYALLRHAAAAGAAIEEGVMVEGPLFDAAGTVSGAVLRRPAGGATGVRARLVIAADGRASRLARCVSLARHPARPRRWAIGGYFTNVSGTTRNGEMHVRCGYYIGVAPLPDGVTNACVVSADRRRVRTAASLLTGALAAEPELGDRFRDAQLIAPPVVLGPLAVDSMGAGRPGLLLAGDAAGFIDPMTGDGLCFAFRGAELAAEEALRTLASGDAGAHIRLARARQREFGVRWRVNRALRHVVGTDIAVRGAGIAARVSTWPVRRLISYAADLDLAARLHPAVPFAAEDTVQPRPVVTAPVHD